MQPYYPNFAGQLTELQKILNQWFQLLIGKVSFGDPDNNSFKDNITGVYVDVTFVANVEKAINHNLQLIPVGYLQISSIVSCNVYQQKGTGTAWTSTKIYLKCDQSTTVRLFILGH